MKHNIALNTSRIFIVFLLITIVSESIFAQNWVDMGVRAENGDIIYWSSSDFALYKNGTVGFVEYGEEGSAFGWGDISGKKTGSDLSQYGGQNPPNKIEGNPKYDIVTAKLGSPYRLPTQREIQALIDNCSISRTTIDRGTPKGANGLPSWVQGQWMINDAVLIGDRVINSAVSIRIDGFIASYYITSGNIFWEGPYGYSGGKITIGNLTFIVDDEKKVLKDRSNNVFKKISSRTVSNQVTGILFTSKINGNQLLFAMPPSVSTYSSSNYSIVTTNSQEIDYWTGTLFDKNSDYAVGMKMTSYEGFGVIAQSRSYHSRIRAIKVEIGSGAKIAEEKRISDSIANEKKRIADSIAREKERQRQEILENKRKSLYGEWIGRYGLFTKIKLVIDNTRMSFYLSGSLIEECPIRISVNGNDLRVEFLEKDNSYYRDELSLSYERQRTSYMQQIGYVTIKTNYYYGIKYEHGYFKVYYREVNESNSRAYMGNEYKKTITLYKSVEKKKTSNAKKETKIGKNQRNNNKSAVKSQNKKGNTVVNNNKLNGHEYVDLGLPSGTKWATCNVGASKPEEYGNYYAYGETTTKDSYVWKTYIYCKGSKNTLTKYCYDANYGNNKFTDKLTTLQSSDDAATANWGDGWRMPTDKEMQELIDNCNTTWTTKNGITGMLFTSKTNGKSIFLPAAGYRNDKELKYTGTVGNYGTSSLRLDRTDWCRILHISSSTASIGADRNRCFGQTIRPVCN